ncbi:hypothetical protein SANA_17730 [Gottschalkiaceae bacterium SANA]|nr:hypothetical protein SANA_17730 [Gottschalkiaceae bacterium SANA]
MKANTRIIGFTLIELLVTLAVVGVFLVVLVQIIVVENQITNGIAERICIEDEERYVSEFLFETIFPVEAVSIHSKETKMPISAIDFSYYENKCSILGCTGWKTIRFVQEGRTLQLWDVTDGYVHVKKALSNHVINAQCTWIEREDHQGTPLLHLFLIFEEGGLEKAYDLYFAMRNLG